MFDIYFNDSYGKLYEHAENGTAHVFVHECEHGIVKSQFIKRQIPLCDGRYYDIVTPYGYGGAVICKTVGQQKQELCASFEKAFEQYAHENNIVTEFVRFHPIIGNADDFNKMYDVRAIRNTVTTLVDCFSDPVASEFSRSARKQISRCLHNGITYSVTENPKKTDIDGFLAAYNSTMERNAAEEYYYFGREYFEQCIEYFPGNIILVEAKYDGITIAAGFYFICDGIIEAHLSGTLEQYLSLSPAYVVKYATAQYAKEVGARLIHYGGGRTNAPDDPLFMFKRKFGTHYLPDYYIGKRIYDEQAYKMLCEASGCEPNDDFFPSYRRHI